jgi:hypothetical protein
VSLTCHDWISERYAPWNQQMVRAAGGYPRQTGRGKDSAPKPAARHEAHWAVKVVTAGEYTIAVRRWPVEANREIDAALPPGLPVPGASQAFRETPGFALPAVSACLRIDGRDLQAVSVEPDACEVRFTVELEAGSHQLAPFFRTSNDHEVGAYYCTVTGPGNR